MSYPKAQLIINYNEFFNENPPEDRISLVKHIARTNLITEILALNYRLKPANQLHVDSSYETQIKELKYFTEISEPLQRRYLLLYNRHVYQGVSRIRENYPLVFTREGCLFAIEEIVNTEAFVEDNEFVMAKTEVWEAIVKYLISINTEITKYNETNDEDNLLESINSKLLSLNESTVEINLVFTPYRGIKLIEFILQNSQYAPQITNYIHTKYGILPDEFIFKIIYLYILTQDSEFQFFYYIHEAGNSLFIALSERQINLDTYKLISIRKSPFIKFNEEMFLISDLGFLLEKSYSQLINDFWFDWLKTKKNQANILEFNISNYRSMIGYFFESYVRNIYVNSFNNYKYSKLLLFDELKVTVKGNQIEIADIYLRYSNKILLGQVKSASIYDDQKFGGDLTSLYRGNRENFFKNFGVNQIIDSIKNVNDLIINLDPKFPKGHSYIIYPIILVNDKALQTALMADIFNKRFQELLVDVNIQKVRVRPLSLIHINEMERLEKHLSSKPGSIWEILEYHTKFRDFIPSFFNTLNHFSISYKFPERVKVEYSALIGKYTGTNDIDLDFSESY